MSRAKDVYAILRALQIIAQESLKLQTSNLKFIYENSSFRLFVEECSKAPPKTPGSSNTKTPGSSNTNIVETLSDTAGRLSTVAHSLNQYLSLAVKDAPVGRSSRPIETSSFENKINPVSQAQTNTTTQSVVKTNTVAHSAIPSSVTTRRLEIQLSPSDKALLRKLDMEHQEKIKKEQADKPKKAEPPIEEPKTEKSKVKSIPNAKKRLQLSSESKQRRVPSSRIERMASFGSLAARLGIGTAAEYVRRAVGIGEKSDASTLFMTPSNLDRIVDTLCKVRGAALKLGQIMSIQDESVVSPELSKALERVRKSADFMPNEQVERVLSSELGENWRENFLEFEEKPFAAASIGQVHIGKTKKDGKEVAIKIQYPGVAKGIESDIDNVCGILNMWNIFPRGMFLENLMNVAKRELAWEVDYTREAECTRRFRKLLEPYKDFYVPEVIDNLSTKQVFTTELLDGTPVDQCFDMELEHRQFIAGKIMELTLLEILEFRYMQTDPNWANFLYNPSRKQILLLDFGASREYSKEFIDKYVKILKAACDGDRKTVLEGSREIGFLTGYESKIMEDAHVDAVMILGEVFRCPDEYSFGTQDMTRRVNNLVPTMLNHRLCPPPEEVYSLHRKLSGVFLLCSKLQAKLACRDQFLSLYNRYINK